jgi:hypothetical protein
MDLGLPCGGDSFQKVAYVGFSSHPPLRIPEIRVLYCPFSSLFVHFHLFSSIDLQNMFSRNTSGTRLKVYAYVLKDCLFLLFWAIIDGYKCGIVTANTCTFTLMRREHVQQNKGMMYNSKELISTRYNIWMDKCISYLSRR